MPSVPAYSAPAPANGVRYPLYVPEFAADPHRVYEDMRARFHAFVPVELAPGVPATLVIRHKTAVKILHDETHFPRDSREWQKTVPQDSPILAMLGYLPAARFNTGPLHERYRSASVASIDGVNLNGLMPLIEDVGTQLINRFCENGYADLMMAGGGLAADHVPWLARAGVRKFHIGSAARPGRSWKAYVDASLVRSWRTLVDDSVAAAL
jgi:cytochrome P450